MFGLGAKKANYEKLPDVRETYDSDFFNGAILHDKDEGLEVRVLRNLLTQGEVNRLDTKELLTQILLTQKAILEELRKQNGTPAISRAA